MSKELAESFRMVDGNLCTTKSDPSFCISKFRFWTAFALPSKCKAMLCCAMLKGILKEPRASPRNQSKARQGNATQREIKGIPASSRNLAPGAFRAHATDPFAQKK